MRSRARVWKLLVCSLLLAVACKDRGSAEQDARPLPAPEPPASSAPIAARDEPAKKRPADDDAKNSAKPKRPAAEASEPKPAAGGAAAASGGAPAGGAPAGAGGTSAGGSAPAAGGSAPAPTSVIPTSVPIIAAPSAACLSRCQTAMQGCLSQPVDGGVPGFANLDLCRRAFEACQASCK